jgi:FixJ family two-component response regulator
MAITQSSGTVFVVDDDPLIRASLEATLVSAGLRAEKFASAEQFLVYAGPHQKGCLLVDVRMPGMNGLELQEELTRRNVPVAVIIMTGHADVSLAVRAMKGGALDILEKPFKRDAAFERGPPKVKICNAEYGPCSSPTSD